MCDAPVGYTTPFALYDHLTGCGVDHLCWETGCQSVRATLNGMRKHYGDCHADIKGGTTRPYVARFPSAARRQDMGKPQRFFLRSVTAPVRRAASSKSKKKKKPTKPASKRASRAPKRKRPSKRRPPSPASSSPSSDEEPPAKKRRPAEPSSSSSSSDEEAAAPKRRRHRRKRKHSADDSDS